jgi:hypothetical protein
VADLLGLLAAYVGGLLPERLMNTLWPHRSCRPVPLHLGQLWCALLNIQPRNLCLPWHLEHFTHGFKLTEPR